MGECCEEKVWIKKKYKKSQTGFIVFLLILLISIVLIALIWNLLNILVEDKSSEINSDLLAVNLDIKEAVIFITGSSKVRVYRGVGGKIDGLKFVFYNSSGSKILNVPGVLNELETGTYNFQTGIGKIEKISVLPMFEGRIGREFVTKEINLLEIPSGLVSWWRFDNLKDFAGENHGSLAGVADIDGSLVLEGNGYFNVVDNKSLDIDDELTLSVWVKGFDGGIVEKGGNYKLKLDEGKVIFGFSKNGIEDITESLEEINNGWNHIAVSLNWNGLLIIYVNGEIAGEKDLGLSNMSPDLNDLELKIGEGFSGEIDEVMIFNRTLSVEQIRGIYNFGRE